MARKEKPTSKVIITYVEGRVEVQIDGFEKLTPAKIQRSFDFVIKEWQLQQQRAIYENRRRERDAEEERRGELERHNEVA